MKNLIIVFFIFTPLLSLADGLDIYADDEVHGHDLIEMVRDEGEEVPSQFANTEIYKATIECRKDRLNSKLSYCTIKDSH